MHLVSDFIIFCVYFSVVNGEQESRIQKGNGYFQVPPHTPVIFGEAGGRTLFRSEWKSPVLMKRLNSPSFLDLVFIISHISFQFQVIMPWFWGRDRVYVTEWNCTSVGYWYHCRCECLKSHNHHHMDNVFDCTLTAFFPASEKHAKIQQDPILPPTSFIIWSQNTQKVCCVYKLHNENN